jgi:hypothetical protein
MAKQPYYEGQEFHNPKDPTAPVLVYRRGQFIPKNADMRGMSEQLSAQERTSLDDARNAATNSIGVLDTLNQFQNQNEGRGLKKQNTGGFASVGNFLAQGFDPEVQHMNALSAAIAPSKRIAGSGTTSDKDLALFLKATPDVYKTREANTGIIEDGRREAVRRQQRAAFLDDWAKQYGTLAGAEQAFLKVVGAGTRQSPLSAKEAGDRSTIPRGAYYYDPQGALRRNDNGSRGNPVIDRPKAVKAAPVGGDLSKMSDAELLGKLNGR